MKSAAKLGCALVEQLEEGVLGVVARLAPDHRARAPPHRLAVPRDALAVALHLELLQVGGKAMQPPVVGQDHLARGALQVLVPHGDQRQQHGQVVRERRRAEMLVQLAATGQQFPEMVAADGDGNRQADGRPE